MLATAADYDPVPYFFTDQYDLGMEYAGDLGDGYDRVVLRGDRDAREFIAFWLLDSRVVAAMNVNVWDVNDTLKGIVRSGSPVDPDRLADPDAALDSLLAADGQ
jgi:3-phenylpropionate/trans-cinnamate dioxygenase ferredoxin reductase subunit